MKSLAASVRLVASFVLAASIAAPATAADGVTAPPEGFTSLFNGKDLEGWWGVGTEDPKEWGALSPEKLEAKRQASLADINEHWSVEDGVLHNDGAGLFLTTLEEYGDFELLVDYNMVAGGDSGVYLRGVPQVQIWDYTEAGGKWHLGADKGSGGLWNNPKGAAGKDPSTLADKPFGEWNRFRIVMVGDKVTVFLNDERVVDHARFYNFFDKEGPLYEKGPIQLQTHGKPIMWRNVFIREIGSDESAAILKAGRVD